MKFATPLGVPSALRQLLRCTFHRSWRCEFGGRVRARLRIGLIAALRKCEKISDELSEAPPSAKCSVELFWVSEDNLESFTKGALESLTSLSSEQGMQLGLCDLCSSV